MTERRLLDFSPDGASGWSDVWNGDLRYPPDPPRGLVRRLLDRLGRLLVPRIIDPLIERQRNYNLAVLDLMRDAEARSEAMKVELQRDARGDLAALQRDVASAAQQLADELRLELDRLHGLIPIAVRRNDALLAALDQKIETLAVRLRDVTNPAIAPLSPVPARTQDLTYRRLEDGLRGSDAEVRDAMQHYAELARAHAPLVDAGCGRGELLQLCRDAGTAARGFDVNERSVADLVARGFDVSLAGIPECFAGIADGSIGSVAAIHVVEHLDVDLLLSLFREAHRVLRTDGLLMIETPNAECLAMTGSDFWRDPTHLAPRHPAALTLLGREQGFAIAELAAVHPWPASNLFATSNEDPASFQRLVDALNQRFFSGQDLRLVLRKT